MIEGIELIPEYTLYFDKYH